MKSKTTFSFQVVVEFYFKSITNIVCQKNFKFRYYDYMQYNSDLLFSFVDCF